MASPHGRCGQRQPCRVRGILPDSGDPVPYRGEIPFTSGAIRLSLRRCAALSAMRPARCTHTSERVARSQPTAKQPSHTNNGARTKTRAPRPRAATHSSLQNFTRRGAARLCGSSEGNAYGGDPSCTYLVKPETLRKECPCPISVHAVKREKTSCAGRGGR